MYPVDTTCRSFLHHQPLPSSTPVLSDPTRPNGQTSRYLCRLHPSSEVEKSSSGGKREKRSGIQDQTTRIS